MLRRDDMLERECGPLGDRLALMVGALVFPPKIDCENECTAELRGEVKELRGEVKELEAELRETARWLRVEHRRRVAAEAALRKEIDDRRGPMDLTYALSTTVFLTANLTSNVGLGVQVGGELRSGPLSIGLELQSVLPSRVVVGPYDLDMSQYAAFLVPCGRYSYFFGCALAGAGAQFGYDSNGPQGPRLNHYDLLQLGGRLGAEIPFAGNRLAVRAWGRSSGARRARDFITASLANQLTSIGNGRMCRRFSGSGWS